MSVGGKHFSGCTHIVESGVQSADNLFGVIL